MIRRTSAAVQLCMSDLSSAMTIALQVNSMIARMPNSRFAKTQTFVIHVVRMLRNWCMMSPGLVVVNPCAAAT